MNVRTTGSSREKKTAASPWSANHASARSRSWGRSSTERPQRSISGRPPARPTPYAIHDPTRFPRVPISPTSTKFRWCEAPTIAPAATAPPNSMVASEGIGMHADSASISTKMAT